MKNMLTPRIIKRRNFKTGNKLAGKVVNNTSRLKRQIRKWKETIYD